AHAHHHAVPNGDAVRGPNPVITSTQQPAPHTRWDVAGSPGRRDRLLALRRRKCPLLLDM
ncbi:hypothetical protein, partial [Sphaerobacter sp.]|uniref:hypothetical protein n=1 Tax=Sphaerobacter sp. TaxID=2099654 RepID=UPI0025CC5A25